MNRFSSENFASSCIMFQQKMIKYLPFLVKMDESLSKSPFKASFRSRNRLGKSPYYHLASLAWGARC